MQHTTIITEKLMTAGWIYPHRNACGITRYSREYIEALRSGGITIVEIDPMLLIRNKPLFLSKVGLCDIVHVQYDTHAFTVRNKDFYLKTIRNIGCPIIVTLHEVYEEDPFAFPRSAITGPLPAKLLRRLIWDVRHPLQNAFLRHLRNGFGASGLIVHHRYHIDILNKCGCPGRPVCVLPHPVVAMAPAAPFRFASLPAVHLGAIGSINPGFNYDLLFSVLSQMKRPWTFTWIGGAKNRDQTLLLESIMTRAGNIGWRGRFLVTGVVSEEQMTRRLFDIDIALALFIHRSTSGSLARILGACKPAVATDIGLVREICDVSPDEAPLLMVKPESDSVINAIEKFIGDPSLQERLLDGMEKYRKKTSYSTLVPMLRTFYCGYMRS